jgi:hypothetical protein
LRDLFLSKFFEIVVAMQVERAWKRMFDPDRSKKKGFTSLSPTHVPRKFSDLHPIQFGNPSSNKVEIFWQRGNGAERGD